jgi:hypothetical protein
MSDMMIPFPVRPKMSPLSRNLALQRRVDSVEFAAYAVVGVSTLSALVLHLTSRGALGDSVPVIVAMAGSLVEFIGLA